MAGIHVCFSIHDARGDYCKYLGITLVSMLENTNCNPIIHIITDSSVSETNLGRLQNLTDLYKCEIHIHKINESRLSRFENAVKIFSIGTLFRFFMAEVLPTDIDKIIYLDDDLVVNCDIEELWQIELGNNTIGACHDQCVKELKEPPGPCIDRDVLEDDYFNQGVLIIDLNKVRSMGDFLQLCINILSAHPEYRFLDQDVFNIIFNGKVKYLLGKYNMFTRYVRRHAVKECECILHFSSDYENPESDCWVDRKLFEYWGKSSWGIELYDYFHPYIECKNRTIEACKVLVSMLAERQRPILLWGINSAWRDEFELQFNLYDRIKAYIDNDKSVIDRVINGKHVYPPIELCKDEYKNAFIIVLSGRCYEEIKGNLENIGKIESTDFIDGLLLLEKR